MNDETARTGDEAKIYGSDPGHALGPQTTRKGPDNARRLRTDSLDADWRIRREMHRHPSVMLVLASLAGGALAVIVGGALIRHRHARKTP